MRVTDWSILETKTEKLVFRGINLSNGQECFIDLNCIRDTSPDPYEMEYWGMGHNEPAVFTATQRTGPASTVSYYLELGPINKEFREVLSAHPATEKLTNYPEQLLGRYLCL